MAQFKAVNASAEVNGETVYSVIDGMGAFKQKALQTLEENGIKDPKPGQWYSQQAWLNAFKKIADSIGPTTLYSIGLKIPENAKFPPEINTIEKALGAIDVAYHMNHRLNGQVLFNPATGAMQEGIGHYTSTKLAEKQIKMVCPNPYPCQFDRGIIECMAKKFKPQGTMSIQIKHDDSQPCRAKGGESCTYLVSW